MEQMQSEVGNEHLTQDDIVDKVLGVTPGYVRGLGHGVKGPSIRWKNSTTTELEITRLELADSQKEVSTLKEKQAEMNAKQTEMDEKTSKNELLENKARLDAFLAAFNSGRP